MTPGSLSIDSQEARAKLTQAKAEAARSRTVKDSGALSEQQVTTYVVAEQTAQAMQTRTPTYW